MDRTMMIARRAYRKFLLEKGCEESTADDYPVRVDGICKREGFNSWDELGLNIISMLEKYGKDGEEAEHGEKSNGSNYQALKLFAEFYICL